MPNLFSGIGRVVWIIVSHNDGPEAATERKILHFLFWLAMHTPGSYVSISFSKQAPGSQRMLLVSGNRFRLLFSLCLC